ncbi:class I adenylate-forming enzyme family protein [Halocynthiibacter sp.]|uniref:class I adenylate-forming enzyme family protein n=1 Tax=Halocynthiibacter sp. TaxID=1979210 RepID=UPI003C352AD0
MNLAHWLERTARENPQAPALFLGQEQVANYREFQARAAGLARSLRDMGVMPGDRIATFVKNCPQYLIVKYATWIAGAAIVPINNKLHARETAWILENAAAKFCFVSADLAEPLREVTELSLVDVSSDYFTDLCNLKPLSVTPRGASDLAWLFYTSGTTGQPKGVMMTHGMLTAMSLAYTNDVDEVRAEDAVIYGAPMSHGAGIYSMLHIRAGARHVCPVSGGFDAAETLDLAAHFGSVQMFMAPTMVRYLLDAAKASGRKGDGLRTIVYAGGPMYNADIIEAVEHFGPVFVQIYGQGECPMGITALSRHDVADRLHPRWRERLGSVGQAQSIVDVMIADADGRPLPAGQTGEIMVQGLPVMPAYWRNVRATEATLVNGWLMTGDMGALDEDGYLTLKDRSKDMIISGGSNIYPREVEECLLMHPDVHEVSVVGRDSAQWGEDVVAFVVAAPGATVDPAGLETHCLENIARFKRPKDYVVVSELPKNNYGKVLKTELRTRLDAKS